MNEKLSYDERRQLHVVSVNILDEARNSLTEFHNIDTDNEVDQALRKEYNFYLSSVKPDDL